MSRVKKAASIFAAAVIAFVACLYVVLYSPFVTPPSIGQNLPSNFEEADKVFQDRVRKEFPGSINEAELVNKLREQGFKIKYVIEKGVNTGFAKFSKSFFPCTLEWRISWNISGDGDPANIKAKNPAINATNVKGLYGGTCL
jgi:hypothetical protein